MKLKDIVNHATDKSLFNSLNNYIAFCERYLEFVESGLQAQIVSQNESHYRFFQYQQDGSYNITRPLNSRLIYDAETFSNAAEKFTATLKILRDGERHSSVHQWNTTFKSGYNLKWSLAYVSSLLR